jgi:hypothetical protein
MDVNQVLLNTFSAGSSPQSWLSRGHKLDTLILTFTDGPTRNAAEQQLTQAAETNFVRPLLLIGVYICVT